MYGEQHLLAYRSEEEGKVAYGLTFKQLGWWIGGGVVSMKLCTLLPPIPFIGLYGYAPYLLPLVLALIFAHIKHPSTQMPLSAYIWSWMKCRKRKRVFY